MPLHHGDLLLGQAVKFVDEAVDFGFQAGYLRAGRVGEDLLHPLGDGGLLGGGGSRDGERFESIWLNFIITILYMNPAIF